MKMWSTLWKCAEENVRININVFHITPDYTIAPLCTSLDSPVSLHQRLLTIVIKAVFIWCWIFVSMIWPVCWSVERFTSPWDRSKSSFSSFSMLSSSSMVTRSSIGKWRVISLFTFPLYLPLLIFFLKRYEVVQCSHYS